jgi:hypothetical protein
VVGREVLEDDTGYWPRLRRDGYWILVSGKSKINSYVHKIRIKHFCSTTTP